MKLLRNRRVLAGAGLVLLLVLIALWPDTVAVQTAAVARPQQTGGALPVKRPLPRRPRRVA